MTKMRQLLMAFIMALPVLAAMPGSHACAETGKVAPGTYRCSSYNVSGAGGSCARMQPLVLHSDGSYQYSSTRGRWMVRDDSLLLSKSELWGPAKIVGSNTIRFEYDYRGLRHVVTWICRDCAAAEPKSTGAAPGGSYVGVSLTLVFDTSVGGVSGFTIVPAEAAASYSHNAPLPAGSAQGLAWETAPATVTLSTNRNNMLRSGRQYVVFLNWPRETIPVAVLDLPALDSDHSATLPATLDGPSVLRRVAR